MKRLFGFGCSFTNYCWSTWFDCLAPEFDWAENWGQSGAGNMYIFNSVMEADQRRKFTEHDTIVICWTNIMRDDRYINNKWVTLGNITSTPVYTKEFIADSVDQRGYLIRDLALIKATLHFLQSKNIKNFKFLSMVPLDYADIDSNKGLPYTDVINLYRNVLDHILPSYLKILKPSGWYNGIKPGQDDHPSPLEHLAYLDQVLPGWVTKQETRVKMYNESINLTKDPSRLGMAKVIRL